MRYLLPVLLLFISCFAQAQTISTIAGSGTEGFSGDGGPATAAMLKRPIATVFDRSGNMYICDAGNYRVRKVGVDGIITTIAGNGTMASTGDGGAATAAAIWPITIAVDTAYNVYISELRRIRKVDPAGVINTIAGIDTFGYNGDGITATDAKLFDPWLGFVDETGAIWFSDKDNHRIRKIDAAGIITTIAGTGISGSSGDGGPATACTMNGSMYLTRNAAGELFFPDGNARRTRKIDVAGNVQAFAGYGAGGSGGGDGGPATSAAVASATIALPDDSGNVYMCMSNANKIRKVDAAGIITTVIGIDAAGYSGDGGPASAAQFNSPAHIARYHGDMYITDMYNNCIRRVYYAPAAVGELAMASTNVAICPNPSVHKMVISSREPITSIKLVDVAGRIVFSAHAASGAAGRTYTIDVSNVCAGNYIVSVNDSYAVKCVVSK